MAAEPGLDTASIERIVGRLQAHDVIREIYLFGSRARGDHRPDSDVDVGIVLTPGGSARGLFVAKADDWQRELATLVGMRVRISEIDPIAECPKPIVALWQRP
jgi:predicted nucleotidyltransferase